MSEREYATRDEILTWVTEVLGPADGASINAGALTIVRNIIGQVAIWEGWETTQPRIVFAEDAGTLLVWKGGAWIGALETCAAAARQATAGKGER